MRRNSLHGAGEGEWGLVGVGHGRAGVHADAKGVDAIATRDSFLDARLAEILVSLTDLAFESRFGTRNDSPVGFRGFAGESADSGEEECVDEGQRAYASRTRTLCLYAVFKVAVALYFRFHCLSFLAAVPNGPS